MMSRSSDLFAMNPVTIPRFVPETNSADILEALFGTEGQNSETDLSHWLRSFFNVADCSLMSSARAGLYWILRTLRPPRLYLPAFICSSLYECAIRAGVPVTFLDNRPLSLNTEFSEIDYIPGSVLLLVHHYGIPADIEGAIELARRHHLVLVEDVAASFGATWRGAPVGGFGDAAIVSFGHTKTISCCGGGAILFKNSEFALKLKNVLSIEKEDVDTKNSWSSSAIAGLVNSIIFQPLVYGSIFLPWIRMRYGAFKNQSSLKIFDGPYSHEFGKARAKLALNVLSRLPQIAQGRRNVAQIYHAKLQNLSEKGVVLPVSLGEPLTNNFPIFVPEGDRGYITRQLWRRGIDPGFSFSSFCSGVDSSAVPVAAKQIHQIISLPTSSHIDTETAVRIASAFHEIVEKLKS